MLKRVLSVVRDVPHYSKLTYCLMRDPRVPWQSKATFSAALALIVSPVDVPLWVPVVGEMDAIALSLLAARLFTAAAPEQVTAEHETLISQGASIFDSDVDKAAATITRLWHRLRGESAADHEFLGTVSPYRSTADAVRSTN